MTHAHSLTRMSAAAVGAVLLIGATASCGLLGGDDPKRDEPGGQITESSDADVFALQVGDCLNVADLNDPEIATVPVSPCDQPHDAEIYAEKTLPKGDFPGDDAVQAAAEEFCIPEFESFVGIGFDQSTLDAFPLTPLEDGWNMRDDRLIQCVVYTEGDPVSASFKGSAQ